MPLRVGSPGHSTGSRADPRGLVDMRDRRAASSAAPQRLALALSKQKGEDSIGRVPLVHNSLGPLRRCRSVSLCLTNVQRSNRAGFAPTCRRSEAVVHRLVHRGCGHQDPTDELRTVMRARCRRRMPSARRTRSQAPRRSREHSRRAWPLSGPSRWRTTSVGVGAVILPLSTVLPHRSPASPAPGNKPGVRPGGRPVRRGA